LIGQPMDKPGKKGIKTKEKPSSPADRRGAGDLQSAATAALLGLALVLFGGRFVVTQALEVSENACLGDLALETAQGRFDAFVFADGDLGHEAL